MDSLVQDRIYKKVPVYDYQGACTNSRNHFSGHGLKIRPLDPFMLFLHFCIKFFATFITLVESAYGAALAYAQDGKKCTIRQEKTYSIFVLLDSLNSEYFDFIEEQSDVEYDIRLCDHKVDLYVLQPDKLNSSGQNNPLKGKLTNCHYTGCERYCTVSFDIHCDDEVIGFAGLLVCKRYRTAI